MIQAIIENWDKIASLLLSIVAICIALISSRQTSKQASQQIEELRKLAESNAADADRQVESIKKMSLEAMDSVKKQMIDMRELAIKVLEYSVFNLEDTIRTTGFEKQELTQKQEELLKKIQEEQEKMRIADEEAKKGHFPDSNILYFYEKESSVLDKKLEYLDKKYRTLVEIKKQLEGVKSDVFNDKKNAIEKSREHGTFDELYSGLEWPYIT